MRFLTALTFSFTLAFVVPAFADAPLPSPAKAAKTAAMHNDAGIAAYKNRDFAGAEEHFTEAVKMDPNFAEAHYNLGFAPHMQNKHKESVVEFKTAVKLAPNNRAITESELTKKHIYR